MSTASFRFFFVWNVDTSELYSLSVRHDLPLTRVPQIRVRDSLGVKYLVPHPYLLIPYPYTRAGIQSHVHH